MEVLTRYSNQHSLLSLMRRRTGCIRLRLTLQQPWDWSMKRIKKMKEKDIRLALLFCMFTALADILCVLFLLGILQSRWVLNVISALAILLHTALALRVCAKTDGSCMGEPAFADWLYRQLHLLQFRMVKGSDFSL